MNTQAQTINCPYCAEGIQAIAKKCKHCNQWLNGNDPNLKQKSRNSAALFAIVFGFIGIHKFYTGNHGWGLLYLIFFWTAIPACIAIVEFIRYLCLSSEEFNQKVMQSKGAFGFIW